MKPARSLSALARASRRRRALSKIFRAKVFNLLLRAHAGVCIISLACAPRRRMLIARNGADRVSQTHSALSEMRTVREKQRSNERAAGEAGRLLYRLRALQYHSPLARSIHSGSAPDCSWSVCVRESKSER
jgi:hypothetical protein